MEVLATHNAISRKFHPHTTHTHPTPTQKPLDVGGGIISPTQRGKSKWGGGRSQEISRCCCHGDRYGKAFTSISQHNNNTIYFPFQPLRVRLRVRVPRRVFRGDPWQRRGAAVPDPLRVQEQAAELPLQGGEAGPSAVQVRVCPRCQKRFQTRQKKSSHKVSSSF